MLISLTKVAAENKKIPEFQHKRLRVLKIVLHQKFFAFSKKSFDVKKLFLILFPLRIYPYDGLGSVGLIPKTYKKFLSNV